MIVLYVFAAIATLEIVVPLIWFGWTEFRDWKKGKRNE